MTSHDPAHIPTPSVASPASVYQQLRAHLGALKLHTAAEQLPVVLDTARDQGWSLTTALEKLLAAEVEADTARRLAGRLRFACLPTPASLEDFDTDAASGIDPALIRELATCRYLDTATNVLLVGPGVIAGLVPDQVCSCRSARSCDCCNVVGVDVRRLRDWPRRLSSLRRSRFSPWACSSAARRAWTSCRCCFFSWLIWVVRVSTIVLSESWAEGLVAWGRAWARRCSMRPRSSWLP